MKLYLDFHMLARGFKRRISSNNFKFITVSMILFGITLFFNIPRVSKKEKWLSLCQIFYSARHHVTKDVLRKRSLIVNRHFVVGRKMCKTSMALSYDATGH